MGVQRTALRKAQKGKEWQCKHCTVINQEPRTSCHACQARSNPRLTEEERCLATVLEPDDIAVNSWVRLSDQGTSDELLLDNLRFVCEEDGACQTDAGPYCWATEDGEVHIWAGRDEPGDDIAALSSVDVLNMIRSIYRIPHSIPEMIAATNGKAARNGSHKPPAAAKGDPDVRWIDVGLIDRFPLNPRDELEFDEESLRDLGATMKERQLQAVLVRPFGDRFQLVVGERRWRAAKLTKLPQLRCEVQEMTEAEAVWACGNENEKRKDWSPIAKARWFRELKRAEELTDEQLAKRVGLSQGQVTSIMGLLDLPEDWQRRVISQEMSPTAVRALIPWAKKRPQVLERVATELKLPGSGAKSTRPAADIPTVHDIDQALRAALEKSTRSMTPSTYGANDPKFSITAKVKESLDVEKIKLYSWGGPVLRAWNVKEWDRLQKEAKARKKAKEPAKARNVNHSSGEYFNQWQLKDALRRWMLELCLPKLKSADEATQFRFAVCAISAMGQEFDDAFMEGTKREDLWSAVGSYKPRELHSALFAAAVKAIEDGENPECLEWHSICKTLQVNVAKEFRPTEDILDPFTTDQLKKFPGVPKELKEKAAIVQHLVGNWEKGFIPDEARQTLGLKPVKGS